MMVGGDERVDGLRGDDGVCVGGGGERVDKGERMVGGGESG